MLARFALHKEEEKGKFLFIKYYTSLSGTMVVIGRTKVRGIFHGFTDEEVMN